MLRSNRFPALLSLLSLLVWSCTSGPEPIAYGQDECAHCRMGITDRRFGSEWVTEKGKIYKFDSIECLVKYYYQQKSANDQGTVWVTAFDQPEAFIPAKDAHYLRSEKRPSPMGMFLSAYNGNAAAENAQKENGGDIMSWEQLKVYIEKENRF